MNDNLRLRAQTIQAARRFLEDEGFIEVETPVLTRSTPEGARDYVLPSRVCGGDWFALPSPPSCSSSCWWAASSGITRPAVSATKTWGRPPAGIHPAGHRDELRGSGADPGTERITDLRHLEGREGHRTAAALPTHDLA